MLGGTSPSGWDCSGYTSFVYGKVGVDLPRTSSAQKGAGQIVSASEAKAGDIIWSPGHVGIYAGDGMMYDAGNTSVDTSYRSVDWMTQQGAQYTACSDLHSELNTENPLVGNAPMRGFLMRAVRSRPSSQPSSHPQSGALSLPSYSAGSSPDASRSPFSHFATARSA